MTTSDEKATVRRESYALQARHWAKSDAAHRRRIRRLIFLGALVLCTWASLEWDARAAVATIPCLLLLATALTRLFKAAEAEASARAVLNVTVAPGERRAQSTYALSVRIVMLDPNAFPQLIEGS